MTRPDPYSATDEQLVMDAYSGIDCSAHGWPLDQPCPVDVARAVLGALVERGHGLAPVIAHQWSVRYPGGVVDSKPFTEAGARQWADTSGGEVVYRAVGPWNTAEEPA